MLSKPCKKSCIRGAGSKNAVSTCKYKRSHLHDFAHDFAQNARFNSARTINLPIFAVFDLFWKFLESLPLGEARWG